MKTAGYIEYKGSAKYNAFMYSFFESCRIVGIKVDIYLHVLLEELRKVIVGEDLTHLLTCYDTK